MSLNVLPNSLVFTTHQACQYVIKFTLNLLNEGYIYIFVEIETNILTYTKPTVMTVKC